MPNCRYGSWDEDRQGAKVLRMRCRDCTFVAERPKEGTTRYSRSYDAMRAALVEHLHTHLLTAEDVFAATRRIRRNKRLRQSLEQYLSRSEKDGHGTAK